MPEYLSSILSDFSYVEFNRYNQPWLIAGSTFMHDPSYHAEYTQKYMTIFSASGDIKIVNQNLKDKLEISSNNVVMLNNVDICNNLTVSNKIDASNIVLRELSSNLANFTSIKADQVDFSGIPIENSPEYTNLRAGFLYQTQDGTIKIKRS